MTDAMVLRGFSPRTQESYADAIYGMAKHYRRDPAEYTAQEVKAYLLYMVKERHLSYSTMNQAACVCLRLGALRVGDIDSAADRMCIRVACDKGGKARYTVLGASLLIYLRFYVRSYRPSFGHNAWLFCNGSGVQPVSIESAQRAYQGARHRAGIMKSGGQHTLRHGFATHLLRKAASTCSPSGSCWATAMSSTTSRYLHLISPQFRPPKDVDPLDLLAGLPKL